MRTIGEKTVKTTAFTSGASKKKIEFSILLKYFSENEFLKDMKIYQKTKTKNKLKASRAL